MGFFGFLFDAMVNGRDYLSRMLIAFFKTLMTSLASRKFSGNSISAYIKENVEPKVKSRKLIIPGKVAVLKGDLEAKLPGWEIIVGPREAVQLVKFLKDMQADGQI